MDDGFMAQLPFMPPAGVAAASLGDEEGAPPREGEAWHVPDPKERG